MVYSLPSSQRISRIHYFPLDANVGQLLSRLVAFKNTKTGRHSAIKQTRPSTKQDLSGEALSKQNTEASLASLSFTRPWRQPSGPPYLHSVYLSADVICSEKRTVFRERSSRKTISYEEQIMTKDKYPSIFSPQMEAIVFGQP